MPAPSDAIEVPAGYGPHNSLVISTTQISTFALCPRKWLFSFVHKLPEKEVIHFELGSVLHKVVEIYLKTGEVTEPESDKLDDAQKDLIRKLVAHGIESGMIAPDSRNIVEHPFIVKLVKVGHTTVFLRSIADLLTVNGITDHKTTSSTRYAKTPAKLAEDPQMLIYGKIWLEGYRATHGTDPAFVQLRHNYFLKDEEDPRTFIRETAVAPSHLDAAWRDLQKCAVKMVEVHRASTRLDKWREWPALPPDPARACSAYGGCPYLGICSSVQNATVAIERHSKRIREQLQMNPLTQKLGMPPTPTPPKGPPPKINGPVPAKPASAPQKAPAGPAKPAAPTAPTAPAKAPVAAKPSTRWVTGPGVDQPKKMTDAEIDAFAAKHPGEVQVHDAKTDKWVVQGEAPTDDVTEGDAPIDGSGAVPPWAVEACKACDGGGWSTAGDPCRICDAKSKTPSHIWVWATGEDGVTTYTPKASADTAAEANAPEAEPPAQEEPGELEVVEAPEAGDTPAETEAKKRGRPKGSRNKTTKGQPGDAGRFILVVGGVADRDVTTLSSVLADWGARLAGASEQASYYNLDAFGRRDALCAQAQFIAAELSGFVCGDRRNPDEAALLVALTQHASAVVYSTQ